MKYTFINSHKPHNSSEKCLTMHHFVAEICKHVQTFAINGTELYMIVHCGICDMVFITNNLCWIKRNKSISATLFCLQELATGISAQYVFQIFHGVKMIITKVTDINQLRYIINIFSAAILTYWLSTLLSWHVESLRPCDAYTHIN